MSALMATAAQNAAVGNAAAPVNDVVAAALAIAAAAPNAAMVAANGEEDEDYPGALNNPDAYADPVLNSHPFSFTRLDHINPPNRITTITHHHLMTIISITEYATSPVAVFPYSDIIVAAYGKAMNPKDFVGEILKAQRHQFRQDITIANGIIVKFYKDFQTVWFVRGAIGCKQWSSNNFLAGDTGLGRVEVYLGLDFTSTSRAGSAMVEPVGGYTALDLDGLLIEIKQRSPWLKRKWRVAEVSRIDKIGQDLARMCTFCGDKKQAAIDNGDPAAAALIRCKAIVEELTVGKGEGCEYCTWNGKSCDAFKPTKGFSGRGEDGPDDDDKDQDFGPKKSRSKRSADAASLTPKRAPSSRLVRKKPNYKED